MLDLLEPDPASLQLLHVSLLPEPALPRSLSVLRQPPFRLGIHQLAIFPCGSSLLPLVMVSPSVQLQRGRVLLLLLKAWRGGSGEARLVAVIISGHHHDLLPRRRGGWGHQLHLRHCVLS
jgi:hypothetical protein